MTRSALAASLLCLCTGTALIAGEAKPKPTPVRAAGDYGPCQGGTIEASFPVARNTANKGLMVACDAKRNAWITYDTDLLRVSAAWSGAFVTLPHGRDGMEGHPIAPERLAFGTKPGPGWAGADASFADPRAKGMGPLPKERARWRGHFLHGQRTVVSYEVAGASVLELPGWIEADGVFTRSLAIGAGAGPLHVLLCERADGNADVARLSSPGTPGSAEAAAADAVGVLRAPDGTLTLAALRGAPAAKLMAKGTALVAQIPTGTRCAIALWSGPADKAAAAAAALAKVAAEDPEPLTKGGPARWAQELTTPCTMAGDAQPYVVDTVAVPLENPWKSYMRIAGFDFLDKDTIAASTFDGDVWIVRGIEGFKQARWRRFATGLFQPLGLACVDGLVHVNCRDGLLRLHDLDKDGEADRYETLNNEVVVTDNYHEFSLDLHVAPNGDFFFVKGTPYPPRVTSPHQGCLFRVPKDGSRLEVWATGFRAPNGMGLGPNGEITVCDNQGEWMPSSKFSWVKQGGFYGMVPGAHRGDKPTSFEQPMCWLPMSWDNSSGGETFITSDRWGPYKGSLVHASYGKSLLYLVLPQQVGETMQGAAVRFPLAFESGVMRGRFSPHDGQLWLGGLKGWQTNAGKAGCIQRVRYTGKPAVLPTAFSVGPTAVTISFPQPMDAAKANDAANWSAEAWNYAWSGAYGSGDFKPSDAKAKGREKLAVAKATLSADGRSVVVDLGRIVPVNQLRLAAKLATAGGQPLDLDIVATVNAVPGAR